MDLPEKRAAVKEKIRGDMRGAHAKNQDRNKKGQFCRMHGLRWGAPLRWRGFGFRWPVQARQGVLLRLRRLGIRLRGKGGGRVAPCVGEGSTTGGRSNRGKVAASVGDSKASGSRAKGGGRVAPSVGGTGEESDSDDKGKVLPVATNPPSSRRPSKLAGISYPVSDASRLQLKKVFVTKNQITNLVCVGSSSSEDVETNGQNNESLMDAFDEYFWPQISTSEETSGNKDSTASSSKEAKETSEERVAPRKNKMKHFMEVGQNSAFPQPSIGERVAHRKRKVQPNKTTSISNKKPSLQKKKKKVNMTSELEILKYRVDMHGESIEEIKLQLAVLTDKVLAMEGEDSEVEPTKTNKIPMKKASLQKEKMVNTASELEILKRQVDVHDDSIEEINMQLGVLIDKVNALDYENSEDDSSADSE